MAEPRAVSIALQKGGVGKTSIAINLADRLAARGDEVLLVDLDQQGNATEGVGLGSAYDADVHLGHVLDDAHDATMAEVVYETEWFDVVPAHRDFDDVESEIRNSTFGELWIRNELDALLGDAYTYVVIDTPPNLGPLADSSLIASQNVLVPLLMSEPSVSGFERMVSQQIRPLQKELDVDIIALVPNQTRGDNEERRIIADIEASPFGERLPAFCRSAQFDAPDSPGPGIRERIAIRRAWREGVPLAAYDPECDMIDRFDELAEVVVRGGVDA